MSFKEKKKVIASGAVIALTITTTSIIYYMNKPNAYEVCINNNPIAYVENANDVEKINGELTDEITKRFGKADIKSKVSLNKVRVENKSLISSTELKDNIKNSVSIEVPGVVMKSDNIEIGILASENEGSKVLEAIKKHYIDASKLNIKQLKECKLKNNITYTKISVEASKVKSIDDVTKFILENNKTSQKPLITVYFKCSVEDREKVSPPVVINWSNELLTGQGKVKQEGKDGVKSITKDLVIENNKVLSIKEVSQSIIQKPLEKIMVRGSKNPSITPAAAISYPSRGRISSTFGMRWGRMHEGIDIAANMGAPIYAAIDGVISFAGYENGYGNIIKIKHDNGLETFYGHCSKLLASVGKKVKKGDKIALVGSTGNSTGPHVHFEVRSKGVAQNPASYLR